MENAEQSSQSDFLIRAPGLEDAQALAAVHVAAWQAAYRGLVEDAYLDALSVEDKARDWRGWLSGETMRAFMAVDARDEAQEKIVGFVSYGNARTPFPGNRGRFSAYSAEIYAIYLHPDVWRQGLGARLLRAAARSLLDERHAGMALWVIDGNRRAVSFYEKLGGQRLGKRPFTIGGREVTECVYGWPDLRKLSGGVPV